MFGFAVHVRAKPGKFQALIDQLTWAADVARESEPDTLRFEFYPDPNDKSALYLYEAYSDRDGFEAHKKNAPYQQWADGGKDELVEDGLILFEGVAMFSTLDESAKARTSGR